MFLNLNIPEATPAIRRNKYNSLVYGILIKSFTSEYVKLTEAKDIFLFNKDKYKHNLVSIKKLLQATTKDWDNFKRMLIFDCLIGNNDRHDENWGLCIDTKELKLYLSPIYDNASCLASGYNEEKIAELLKNNNIEKHVLSKKSRPPNLYINKDDGKKYTHYEIINHLIKTEENMIQLIKNMLKNDYIDFIDSIITNIQHLDLPELHKITDNRAKAMLNILKLRRKKLKELI